MTHKHSQDRVHEERSRNRICPTKGIDTTSAVPSCNTNRHVEMSIARLRALTQLFSASARVRDVVEIGFARLRALTHHPLPAKSNTVRGKNRICPTKGIDTTTFGKTYSFQYFVKIGSARLRALTCTMNNSECMKVCYSEFFKVFQSSLGSDFL